MDEGSTDSKIDDLLRFVSSLVQRQREEVWPVFIISISVIIIIIINKSLHYVQFKRKNDRHFSHLTMVRATKMTLRKCVA